MIGHNVWPPNIHSRPLELYPLYKCRAGHLVFSKVAVSQVWHDTIGTTWHWQNTLSAEQGCRQNTLSAEQGCRKNTLSAEHVVGRTRCRQNKAVGRTHCRQNKAVSRTRRRQNNAVGRTHCRQNKVVGRTRLSAEHDCRQNCFLGNVGFEPTTAAAQHVISNLPSA